MARGSPNWTWDLRKQILGTAHNPEELDQFLAFHVFDEGVPPFRWKRIDGTEPVDDVGRTKGNAGGG